MPFRVCVCIGTLALLIAAGATPSAAQSATFKPEVGQPGKDVVWVPTPEALVERCWTSPKWAGTIS